MDILDILIAKKQSSDAQADAAVRKAQEAVQKANQVTAKIDEAQELLTTAETAIAELNEAKESLDNLDNTIDEKVHDVVDTEYMPSITSNFTNINNNINTINQSIATLEENAAEPITLYTTTGQHTDGTMTQKAITDALNAIPQGSGSGDGTSKTFPDAIGQMIAVGEDATVTPSSVAEVDMVDLLIKSSAYNNDNAVGIEIDYENRTITRTQAAAKVTSETDIPDFFNHFKMYGGIKRCVLADDGHIVAFEGDSNYSENGNLGQVMVYMPAFYYKRTPMKVSNGTIKKESLILSDRPFPGAKRHPFFYENDYAFFSAYEGSIYRAATQTYDLNDESGVDFDNDKLSSIANAKPASGAKNTLNLDHAFDLACARGDFWSLTSHRAISAIQMLMIVEYGTFNMQNAIGLGVCNVSSVSEVNCAAITGATSSLGSVTGVAPSTTIEISGARTTYTTPGYSSISYRGIENPWGNLWQLVDGLEVSGDGRSRGGKIAGVTLPAASNYITGFGALEDEYDYLFIPVEASGGNSNLPVGDYVWITNGLNQVNVGLVGGRNSTGDRNGPFSYSWDNSYDFYSHGVGARLIASACDKESSNYSRNIMLWERAIKSSGKSYYSQWLDIGG